MKVLIIHQYFKTPEEGGALRSYYLAKALVERGFQVSVITTYNHSGLKTSFFEGIEIHYLPILYSNNFGFFKRINSFLKFIFSIVREAGRFKNVDVCYAISTPLTTGVAAMWIKWRYKIPFYFEVGDLWPEAPIQLGVIKNPVLKFVLRKLEKRIYQVSAKVVALSNAIRDEIQKSIPQKAIPVIPNMADTDFFIPEQKRDTFIQKFKVQNRLVVSYIGTLGLANGFDFLLDCAGAALRENLAVQFLIVGEGAEFKRLDGVIKSKSLDNVSLLPFQNRNGVKEILNVTDAIFVSFKPLPVLETGSPNKYFDGLAAGKLVINNFGGWVMKEIEENSCGVTANSPNQFVEKLKPFLGQSDLLKKYQGNARALALNKYSRKLLSEQFVNLFMIDAQ